MSKIRTFLLLALLFVLSLSACSTVRAQSAATYFDGEILVEYNQFNKSGISDYLEITFYKEGTYDLYFFYNEEHSSRRGDLPEDFTFTVEDSPRVLIVEEYVLADFLTIRIDGPSGTESHNFQ